VVEDPPVGLSRDEIDRVGLPPVGQPLAGEVDLVPGEVGVQLDLAPVVGPVLDLRGDGREGVLEEGTLDLPKN
jgi:hypothetical protein